MTALSSPLMSITGLCSVISESTLHDTAKHIIAV